MAAHALVIFDWDDTLYPNRVLGSGDQVGRLVAAGLDLDDLVALDVRAAATLRLAKELAQVVIVTNAGEGWVEHTSELLPLVREELEGVPIYSARALHEHEGDGVPAWKRRCFACLIARHCARGVRHVLSVGDQDWERYAVQAASAQVQAVCSSVRLLPGPTLHELAAQHEELQARLREWLFAAVPSDLGFAQPRAPPQAPWPKWLKQAPSEGSTASGSEWSADSPRGREAPDAELGQED